MDATIRLTHEGFKWRRTPEGAENADSAPEIAELFAHEEGAACFQVVLRAPERFALSTGKKHWYSPSGHRDRYRLDVAAQGAQVQAWIEDGILDDGGCLRADVLLSQEEKEYEAGSAAVVFVQVRAPRTTQVRVRVYHAFGTHPEELLCERTLPLSVYPVRLPAPEEYAFYLDLWQHPSNLARKHETPLWSDAHFAVIERYARTMAALGQKSVTVLAGDVPWRGQGCMDNDRFPADLFEYAMVRSVRHADGSVEPDFSVMDRYIDAFERCGVRGDIEILGLCNIWKKDSFDDHPLVPGDPEPYISLPCLDERTGALSYLDKPEQVDAFIAALEAHLDETGRLSRARLSADEPADIPAYRRSVERIRRVAPRLRLKTAINHAEFIPAFSDAIDDFIPSLASVCEQYDELQRIRRDLPGKRFLWYVCCAPAHPNTYLHSDLCETRLIGALTRHMGFDGFLRWAYTTWPADPRRDARYGAFPAGDTHFVYPAANGEPLLSLRYMALRRAIEDFEILRLLDAQGLGEQADALAASVLREPDVRKWFHGEEPIPLQEICSTDYGDYERLRREALALLSR